MNHDTSSCFSTGRAALLLTLLLTIAGLPTMAGAQIFVNQIASGDNDAGVSATTSEVANTNQMPIADAGPDQTATLNDSLVQLDGSGSFDPDGHEPLTYDWTQTAGPAVVLSDSGAVAPTFTAPSMTTTLTFTLVVTDSLGLSSLPDETIITVVDLPIEGLTATNDGPTVVGDTTEFIAFITSGTGVSYTWDFGDGNSGNGPLADNDYTAAGDYTATVTASNTAGSLTATTLVTIADVPVAGLVAANDSPTVAGQATDFTATVSDGTGVVYTWDFGDGIGSGSGATPSYVYGAAGEFTATVTASNGANSLVDTTTVTVTNTAPVADAGPDQTIFVEQPVQLDGSGSFDPDGHAISYQWQQVAGTPVTLDDDTAVMPTFTAPSLPATLSFTLTVTDPFSADDFDSVEITVNDVPITGLQAANDGSTTLGNVTQFTAIMTAGSNVIYDWDFGDGNSALDTGATPTHTYAEAGDFTASVTARNSENQQTTTTSVAVTNLPPIADAGSDQSVDAGELLTLDGSGSTDPDGHEPLTYQWSQVAGETVTLSDATLVNPTFTAPFDETPLVFELIVTDSFGLASEPADSVTVSVTLPEFEVSTSVGNGQGNVTPDSQDVTWGENASFTVTPEAGWSTTTVTGDTCTPTNTDEESWVVSNVIEDCAVTADFAIDVYTVTATVAAGQGSILPPSQNVEHGESAVFTVESAAGWSIDTITADTCHPEVTGDDQWQVPNITEDCAVEANFAINQYSVGGELSGLEGMGLTLDLNGIETLVIGADGPFTFTTELDHDSDYMVTVTAQPTNPSQTCEIANASDRINANDVTNVAVSCATPALVLDLDVIAFGVIDAESEANAAVRLTNNAEAPVTISEITIPDEPFAVIGGSCLPVPTTLDPGEDCTIEVTYAPGSTTGQHGSHFEIISDAPSSPDQVQLSGHSFSAIPVPINRFATLATLALLLLMAGWWRSQRQQAGETRTKNR